MEILNRLQFKHDPYLYDSFDEIREAVFFAIADENQRENAALYAEPIVFKYKGKDENHPNIVLGIGSFGDGYTIDRKNSYFFIDTAKLEYDIADLDKREKQDRKDLDTTISALTNSITALGFEKDGTFKPLDHGKIISGVTTIREIVDILDAAITKETEDRIKVVSDEQAAREKADENINETIGTGFGPDYTITHAIEMLRDHLAETDKNVQDNKDNIDANAKAIEKESDDRKAADNELKEYLTSADTAIRQEMAVINSALTAAIETVKDDAHKELDERITKEEKDRREEDAKLHTLIFEQVGEIDGKIEDVKKDIEAEKNRAEAKEEEILDVIDNIVAKNDKVLTMSAMRQISSHVSLDYDSNFIYLKGVNGAEISRVDASAFIKDGMINKVELVETQPDGKDYGTYLHIIWNTDAGHEDTYISLDKLINIYTVADGSESYLTIKDNKIGVKVDEVGGLASNTALDSEIKRAQGIEDTLIKNVQDNAKNIASNTSAITANASGISENKESIKDINNKIGTGFEDATITHVIKEISANTVDNAEHCDKLSGETKEIRDIIGEGFVSKGYTITHAFEHINEQLNGITGSKVKDVTYGGVSLVNALGIAVLDAFTPGGGGGSIDPATLQIINNRFDALEARIKELEDKLKEGVLTDIQPLDDDIIIKVSGNTTYIGISGVTQNN